jgi:GTPase SAR1 family protein
VYDITNKASFNDAVKYWYAEIKSQCPPDTDVLLVGNKADLESLREVSKEEVSAFTLSNGVEHI